MIYLKIYRSIFLLFLVRVFVFCYALNVCRQVNVGMERMLCWWLAELLLVVGGASVCDWWSFCWRKNKAFVWGDSKVLFVVKKRSFLPNALWNAFFFL